MDDNALELMGSLMQASHAQTTHTMQTLLDTAQADVRRLRSQIIAIADILDNATVIDRLTEDRIAAWMVHADNAAENLAREEQAS